MEHTPVEGKGDNVSQELMVKPGVTPTDIVTKGVSQATVLRDIVEKQKIFTEIAGKKYLEVEAWEIIGAFYNVNACTDYVNPIKDDKENIVGYEAQVSLYKEGRIVGSAIMSCGLDEFPCQGKEGSAKHKAARSAAQTWAESKAYRMNFSWVVKLAGFEPVPAEEVMQAPPKAIAKGKPSKQQPADDIKHLRQQLHLKWKQLQEADSNIGSKKDFLKDKFGVESSTELTLEQTKEALKITDNWIRAASGGEASPEEKTKLVKELMATGKSSNEVREIFYSITNKKGGWTVKDLEKIRAQTLEAPEASSADGEAKDFLDELES